MNYTEAMDRLLKVEWKTEVCHTGSECWCRVVGPMHSIECDEDEDIYVIGSGMVTKEMADHIVMVHNKYINNR